MEEPLIIRLGRLEKTLRDEAEQFVEPEQFKKYLQRAEIVLEQAKPRPGETVLDTVQVEGF